MEDDYEIFHEQSDDELNPRAFPDELFVHNKYSQSIAQHDVRLMGHINQSHSNQFVHHRIFKRYVEVLNSAFKKTNLPLSENTKSNVVRSTYEFYKYLKRVLNSRRVQLKTCFICVAYHVIRQELQTELLDLDFVIDVFFKGKAYRRGILGLYMNLFKKNFASISSRAYEKELVSLTNLVIEKFLMSTESTVLYQNYHSKYKEFIKKFIDFSHQLTLSLKTKKVKHVATGLAYVVVKLFHSVDINIKDFVTIINESKVDKQDTPALAFKPEAKLIRTVLYHSVSNVYLKIVSFFAQFFAKEILGNQLIFSKLMSKKNTLKRTVMFLRMISEDKSLMKKNFPSLIKVCFAVKQNLLQIPTPVHSPTE